MSATPPAHKGKLTRSINLDLVPVLSTWPSCSRVCPSSCVVAADTSDTVYSLHGSVLKFDDLPSIQPYLTQLDEVKDLQEVRFGGNTRGVDACKGVADALAEKKNLKVCTVHNRA